MDMKLYALLKNNIKAEINKILNDNDITDIDTLQEISAWINEHSEEVLSMKDYIDEVAQQSQANYEATEIKMVDLINSTYTQEEVETIVEEAISWGKF